MATWILSDPHAGSDPDVDDALLRLIVHAEGRADLLILGDLFTVWLGPSHHHTALQRRVLNAIAKVKQSGRRVDFVVGNRDYLVTAKHLGHVFTRIVRGEHVVPIEGQPTLVCHGDGLDTRDKPYRLWAAVSRSKPASWFLERIPGRAGRAIASGTARRLAPLGGKHKTQGLPVADLEALGRRAFASGAVRALVGHFHHPATLPVPGGAPVTIAPGFVYHRQVLVTKSRDLVRPTSRTSQRPSEDALAYLQGSRRRGAVPKT
ncbi:MAG: UDP-2,3-diacylglucosamine diphosphatase [Myxococcales bacterium]|nr:UDP-2,3-diacylglucosamine diphosphatase [Myxococcales bacterium]